MSERSAAAKERIPVIEGVLKEVPDMCFCMPKTDIRELMNLAYLRGLAVGRAEGRAEKVTTETNYGGTDGQDAA